MEWHLRNRTAYRSPFVKEDIQMPMKSMWDLTLPDGIFDTPIYAEGAIFVIATSGLYKLNSETGEIFWNIKPDAPIQSSPAYHNGRIYFSSQTQGILYCVDSSNGKEIWQLDSGGDAGSCCIDDKNMYLYCFKKANDHQVSGFACMSLANNEDVWFHACEKSTSVNACALGNGILVYGDVAGNVYGLESSTGREIWKINTTDLFPFIEAGPGQKKIPYATGVPIIVGDVVFLNAATPGRTFGLDLNNGQVLWTYTDKEEGIWNYSGMSVDDKNWYCLTMFRRDPMHYFSFDIKTGDAVFKKDISKYKEELGNMNMFSRTGLVIGNYHFVGVYDPPLIAAFNKNTGELAWTHSVNRSNLRGDGRGIYAGGKLIWFRYTGDVYGFE